MKLKALIAFVCVVATVFACSAFALAEESGIENAIPAATESRAEGAPEATVEPVSEDKAEETVIERSEKWSSDFDVLMNDYVGSSVCYYSSVKDAIADYGTDLYYPAYEGYENASSASIIYSARGENGEGPKVFQIEYAREDLEICWIEVGVTFAGESMNPYAEKYESHETVFYICQYAEEGPNGYGGHYVQGVLEGNCYSFFTKTHEEAKLIIDSLTKAE